MEHTVTNPQPTVYAADPQALKAVEVVAAAELAQATWVVPPSPPRMQSWQIEGLYIGIPY